MRINVTFSKVPSLFVGVDPNSKDDKGISNSFKALLLERGTLYSASRPFLTLAKEALLKDKHFLDLYINDPQKAGEYAVKLVKEIMDNFPFEPLKTATLKARRRKGNESFQPTVDTASLRKSIIWDMTL